MSDDPLACLTLDLENDWYFDDPEYDHLTFEYIDDYIEEMQRLDVPVTFFVVGKTIERYPEVIDKLDTELDSEFHLHSYQHDTSKSYDFRTEIRKGKEAFASHFGSEPTGYRAPQGNIAPAEFAILEDEGFDFDSSIFPSFRPGVYSNLDKPLAPYCPEGTDELVEVPIAATPGTRILVCQSYLKLLGRPYLTYLKYAPLPDPLVFNTHLQDFYETDSHDRLSQPKQSIMKRNLDGSLELFADAVERLRSRGYEFGTMTDVIEAHSPSCVELVYDSTEVGSRESPDPVSQQHDHLSTTNDD
ncbi:polysaccharide deacetylase family protein [Natronococcus sp. A-GB1]|uniref:polysaccharide deacetylase family protein n=1 Tax=Natronococcus sp. A-GB1 TaxID=3037648 RepID=UPI00241D4D5F|nr:polysaccharide deacetylase family protein [Natronococcus sp. A-GB1]MDG5761558.1 polysaccharide deacetylase family protein [Natronococcus sp. A-GB1]